MKRLSLSFVAVGFGLVFCFGAAARGFRTEGGGFVHKGRPLDIAEAEHRGLEFIAKPTGLAGMKEVVEPTLAKIDQLVPRFAADLREILDTRIWRFVGGDLRAPESPDSELESQICGVVSALYFSILKPCYLSTRTNYDKGAFLLHELVRQLGLRESAGQTQVRELVQIVLLHPGLTAKHLVNALEHLGFGKYDTIEELRLRKAPVELYRLARPEVGRLFDYESTIKNFYAFTSTQIKSNLAKRSAALPHKFHAVLYCYDYLSNFLDRLEEPYGYRYACCYSDDRPETADGPGSVSATVQLIKENCKKGDLAISVAAWTDANWGFNDVLKHSSMENATAAAKISGALPRSAIIEKRR